MPERAPTPGPEFLKDKYGLHKAPEVESAAQRAEKRSRLRNASADQAGEKIPQTPEARIQTYLDRFTEIIEREDPTKRERGIEAIKRLLYDRYVIKPDQVPEAYFENQRRLAREQGRGDIETTGEMRQQLMEVITADQRSSLDTWVDYLASKDATYPDWLKYYALRSVVTMGEYDKEKKVFTKRSTGTVKPFPDLNREALAYVLDSIEKKYAGQGIDLEAVEEQDRAKFKQLIAGENFPKLYAWAIEKVTPAQAEQLATTQGKWIKYEQWSDHMPLVKSLQGHGTGWCTAGESTARSQLDGGDFYVYYSHDQQGRSTIPRVAIRMEDERIAEVRGVAEQQNLDPYVGEVVEKKLKEFGPEGEAYRKKTADMKKLTEIDNKAKASEELTKDDLVFLYELDAPIEGFGYQRDPRIEELRSKRNPEQDMPILFECTPEQIARTPTAISATTKAYVGPLEPGIFPTLAKHAIDHIYTQFPERRIRRETLTIGGKTSQELQRELEAGGFLPIQDYARDMLKSKDFYTSATPQNIDLIRLTVEDLGFSDYATTEQLYRRARQLGLDPAPAEAGPYLRLKLTNQPEGEWLYIGMQPIAGRVGRPDVFAVGRSGDNLWLDHHWAEPTFRWLPVGVIVFRPRTPSDDKQVTRGILGMFGKRRL